MSTLYLGIYIPTWQFAKHSVYDWIHSLLPKWQLHILENQACSLPIWGLPGGSSPTLYLGDFNLSHYLGMGYLWELPTLHYPNKHGVPRSSILSCVYAWEAPAEASQACFVSILSTASLYTSEKLHSLAILVTKAFLSGFCPIRHLRKHRRPGRLQSHVVCIPSEASKPSSKWGLYAQEISHL